MKTNNITRFALLIALPLSMSTMVFGQRQQRESSNRTDNEGSRTTRSREQQEQKSHVSNDKRTESHKNYQYDKPGKGNNKSHNAHNNYGQSKKNDAYHHNKGRDYGRHNDYNRHDNHKHHKTVYYRHLPGKKYDRYVMNGIHYYHCDGHFYRHHSGNGYVRVDAPYLIVDVLPRHYSIRYHNGNRLIFSRGYYFVPVQYGWMMIPEPVSPQFSFNIHIGL